MKGIPNLRKGIAQFSGTVDRVRHIGDNEYGRTGDWIDVAVFGGIIKVPALIDVNVDDSIVVRGYLRNTGRALDIEAQEILVCRNDQEMELWERASFPTYRAFMIFSVNVFDRVSIVNKAIVQYSARFRGMGLQFGCRLEEKQYLELKSYIDKPMEWEFDLIRDFRSTGAQGARNTVDTWNLTNPRPLKPRAASKPVQVAEK